MLRLLALLLPICFAIEARAACPVCRPAIVAGKITKKKIREPSGVAQSALHPGVYYVHNDSGDKSRFFAIDLSGALLGTFLVDQAANVDWEDVAVAPCGKESCIYLADIGEGKHKRASYTLYRVREPAVLEGGKKHVAGEAFTFTYPDGAAHDAETLLVDPRNGAVFIITKVKTGRSAIYQLPLSDKPVVLKPAGEIAPPAGNPRFTGGAVEPKGTGILLRTYSHVLYYPLAAGEDVPKALAKSACVLPAPQEAQGESVTFLPNGYLTIDEREHAELHRVECH